MPSLTTFAFERFLPSLTLWLPPRTVPLSPRTVPKDFSLQDLAQQCNVSIDAVSLAAILVQPWANVVLSGASTAEQLRSNYRSLQVAEHLLADQVLGRFL